MPSTTKPTQRLDYSKPATQQKTLQGHSSIVTALAVLPDGRVVSGSLDKTLKVWDSKIGQCLATLSGHSDWVEALAVLPDGRVVSGSNDHTLKVWDSQTGRCLTTLSRHSVFVHALAVLPDERVVSGEVIDLKVWDSKTGQCLKTLSGHSSYVFALAILPDGRVVSGSKDKTLKVWDSKTGQCLMTLAGHSSTVLALAVLPDGRVVSGSSDKTLKVWDSKTGQCLATLSGHSHGVNAVAVLPDGRVVSGSGDNTLKVWDMKGGTCLQTLPGHSHSVSAVAVLPDGRIVSGANDHTLKVWDFPALEKALSDSSQPVQVQTSLEKQEQEEQKASPPTPTIPSLEVKFAALQVSFQIAYAELKLGKELGRGGFGVVYQGTYRYNKVAVKQLLLTEPTPDTLKEFQQEMEILSKLRSPQIVQLYGICQEPGHYCMVMEYMAKGSLYKVLHSGEPLTWTLRENIALDLTKGLAFLHSEKIVHRDLKSLNVLLDGSYKAKLCDFGLAKIKTETASTTKHEGAAGTLAWMAPELFMPKVKYTDKADMYSYGMILWELSSRKVPYQDASNPALIPMWVAQGHREDIPEETPPKLAKLIKFCWEAKPENRPSAKQALEALDENNLYSFTAQK